ncbi:MULTISPECIES: hypothetical protein [Methylococcus]|uniref:Uncharacterized protein n=1 Tax=Methylococcus capsulatus TaxID=414 RepID=A0ABZ2F545_METCP|nr:MULTISPECIES: hypothetical protein [Methylococcus]MDF9393387.1 hypothetical protein [Methylococcus capsulatus]
MAVLVKTPERTRHACEDFVRHVRVKVGPNGFKVPSVTFARESCLLCKQELGNPSPEVAAVAMAMNANEPQYQDYAGSRDEGRVCTNASATPATAQTYHRHLVAIDRLRCAHRASHAPGQAAARSHAAPGHLPGEPT